jgi:hypothetical protein
MALVPRTANEGTPFPGEPFVFLYFGNVSPAYIATLSLPRFTIGLLVWSFSTPVISNAPGPSNTIPSPQEDPSHVDPSPSSLVVSSSLSSPSPSEIFEVGNQGDKKKNKRKIRKKKNKQGDKIPTTAGHVGSNQPVTVNRFGNIDESHKLTKTTRKPKFPWRLCNGDHLLKDCHGIPKVLDTWSTSSKQPVSLSFESHAGDKPSTSGSNVGETKSRVKFPCRLCEGSHQTHLCPCIDEALKLLEEIIVVQQRIPTIYHEFYPNPPLVDQAVDLIPSSVDLTLPLKSEFKVVDMVPSSLDTTVPLKSEVQVFNSIPSLVDPTLPLKSEIKVIVLIPSSIGPALSLESDILQVIDLIPSLVDPTLPLDSEVDTTHIFLVNVDSSVQGGIYPSTMDPLQVVRPLFSIGMS